MLEKNKDYVEMLVYSTDCAFTQNGANMSINGYSEGSCWRLPDPSKHYIFVSKEKFEALQTENEQLKKKLEEFSLVPGYREFLTALFPEEDIEKIVWATEQICGGQVSVNGWMRSAKFWKKRYDDICKLVGFSSVEEIQDYLTNEAECDTLHEAISNSRDQVKYTCDEWKDMKKKLEECEEDYISERDKAEALEKEIGIYSRTLNEWKEGTGCPSPSEAKNAIGSGMSWHHAYNELKETNRKLGITIEAWKNVTGYSTPEDYLAAKIRTIYVKLEPSNVTWRDATGCDTPEEAGCKINRLCDDICKLKGNYDRLLKFTGYKSEKDIRVMLNLHEQFVYENMRELINSLKRKSKFTDSNWQNATGCDTPEEAETTMRNLRGKIDEIKEFAAIASNWTDRIVEG